jgi:hypothetical protein
MGEHTIEIVVTIITALITAIIGPIFIEYVKVKYSKDKSLPEDPVKKELEQSTIITDELEDIREILNADRVWITIIHNGGHFLHSNKSIQKFSVMHEVAKPGVSSIGMIFKNIPISLFSKAIDRQSKGNIIYISNVDDPTVCTFGLKPGFESTGTKAAISKGLFDIATDSLIGTIGADFLTPKELTETEIELFKGKGERMSGFISNFIKDF